MKFDMPHSIDNLLEILSNASEDRLLLAGGSDINIMLRQRNYQPAQMIMINHLSELSGIKLKNKRLIIGAVTTIAEISSSGLIREHCPFLADALKDFASPPIANFATIAGNIANSSPTADTVPLLLVLEAELVLRSKSGFRKVALADFYTGYKKTTISPSELIYSIEIPLREKTDYSSRYIKVGSRTVLTIAKLSLALIKDRGVFKISAGSLNEYPRRLNNVEMYLNGLKGNYEKKALIDHLKKDITPITDFRSDAEYRLQVCCNYLISFLDSIDHE